MERPRSKGQTDDHWSKIREESDDEDWLGPTVPDLVQEEQPQPLPAPVLRVVPAGQPNELVLKGVGSYCAGTSSKKKTKTNGYLLFVYQRKREVEQETGKKMSEPLPSLMKMFDADYKALSPQEKEKWKNRAKDKDSQGASSTRGQPQHRHTIGLEGKQVWTPKNFTTNRVTTPSPPVYKTEISVGPGRKTLEVRRVLSMLPKGDMTLKTFAVINFNCYPKQIIHHDEHVPSELGITAFSIANGVSFLLNSLINPELGEKWNYYETKVIMEKYGLPSSDMYDSKEQGDYQLVLEGIKNTLAKVNDTNGTNTDKVCFAPNKYIPFVDGCLYWLMRKTGQFFPVKVHSLEALMSELVVRSKGRTPVDNFCSENEAMLRLSSGIYGFRVDLGCRWHKQLQHQDIVSRCALHKTMSQAYIASEMLAECYGIQPLAECHFPKLELATCVQVEPPVENEDERCGKTSLEIRAERLAQQSINDIEVLSPVEWVEKKPDPSMNNEAEDIAKLRELETLQENEEGKGEVKSDEKKNNPGRLSQRMIRSMQNLFG